MDTSIYKHDKMKTVLGIILNLSFLLFPQLLKSQKYTIFCDTWECLKNNKGQNTIIQGVLYIDQYEGWHLRLSDKRSVRVNSALDRNGTLDFCSLLEKEVLIKGYIFFGLVSGGRGIDIEEPLGSFSTQQGIRIDPDQIVIYSKKTKKEWMNE